MFLKICPRVKTFSAPRACDVLPVALRSLDDEKIGGVTGLDEISIFPRRNQFREDLLTALTYLHLEGGEVNPFRGDGLPDFGDHKCIAAAIFRRDIYVPFDVHEKYRAWSRCGFILMTLRFSLIQFFQSESGKYLFGKLPIGLQAFRLMKYKSLRIGY